MFLALLFLCVIEELLITNLLKPPRWETVKFLAPLHFQENFQNFEELIFELGKSLVFEEFLRILSFREVFDPILTLADPIRILSPDPFQSRWSDPIRYFLLYLTPPALLRLLSRKNFRRSPHFAKFQRPIRSDPNPHFGEFEMKANQP